MTSADSPLTELRETVAPALRAVRWYAAEIVVGIAVVVTALAALALTGAAVDDAAIDARAGDGHRRGPRQLLLPHADPVPDGQRAGGRARSAGCSTRAG